MNKTIEGKAGIKATVLKDSISQQGVRLVTFEIEYPRIILAEINTHKMLSRGSASSRAIPFEKMAQNLTGRPVRFGQANPGMQDKGEEHNALVEIPWERTGMDRPSWFSSERCWEGAKEDALAWAEALHNAGYHKQVFNRLTEPFQMMKTVISATEWNNFFFLRNHEAADPTLQELARCMKEAMDSSKARLLFDGEWHLPYVEGGGGIYWIENEHGQPEFLSLEDAKKVSAARCAAVSFRNIDYGVEKSRQVFERLVGDERKHASAFEHQATPMSPTLDYSPDTFALNKPQEPETWEEGVSHTDRQGNLWSGNFRGWIQHRKLIAGENAPG